MMRGGGGEHWAVGTIASKKSAWGEKSLLVAWISFPDWEQPCDRFTASYKLAGSIDLSKKDLPEDIVIVGIYK